MRKRQLLSLVVVSVLLFTIWGVPITSAEPRSIDLKCATFGPDVHPHSIALMDFCKEIEKRTNGRVKIAYYGSETLLRGPAIYDGVATGVTDIGMTILSYTRGRFPLMSGFELPLGYPSGVIATKVANDAYWKFVPKELTDTHLLYLNAFGPSVILTKKPVRTLDDLKGLKIRGTGSSTKILEALGAVPVAVPITESYDSLRKGVVDGTIVPMESLVGWKFAEVIEYITNCYRIGSTNILWVGMNNSRWNALPKDIQKILSEVSKEWADRHGKIWDDMDIRGRELALKLGRQIIELPSQEHDRWVAAVQPVIKEYIADMGKKGLPGQELINYVNERIKKYSK